MAIGFRKQSAEVSPTTQDTHESYTPSSKRPSVVSSPLESHQTNAPPSISHKGPSSSTDQPADVNSPPETNYDWFPIPTSAPAPISVAFPTSTVQDNLTALGEEVERPVLISALKSSDPSQPSRNPSRTEDRKVRFPNSPISQTWRYKEDSDRASITSTATAESSKSSSEPTSSAPSGSIMPGATYERERRSSLIPTMPNTPVLPSPLPTSISELPGFGNSGIRNPFQQVHPFGIGSGVGTSDIYSILQSKRVSTPSGLTIPDMDPISERSRSTSPAPLSQVSMQKKLDQRFSDPPVTILSETDIPHRQMWHLDPPQPLPPFHLQTFSSPSIAPKMMRLDSEKRQPNNTGTLSLFEKALLPDPDNQTLETTSPRAKAKSQRPQWEPQDVPLPQSPEPEDLRSFSPRVRSVSGNGITEFAHFNIGQPSKASQVAAAATRKSILKNSKKSSSSTSPHNGQSTSTLSRGTLSGITEAVPYSNPFDDLPQSSAAPSNPWASVSIPLIPTKLNTPSILARDLPTQSEKEVEKELSPPHLPISPPLSPDPVNASIKPSSIEPSLSDPLPISPPRTPHVPAPGASASTNSKGIKANGKGSDNDMPPKRSKKTTSGQQKVKGKKPSELNEGNEEGANDTFKEVNEDVKDQTLVEKQITDEDGGVTPQKDEKDKEKDKENQGSESRPMTPAPVGILLGETNTEEADLLKRDGEIGDAKTEISKSTDFDSSNVSPTPSTKKNKKQAKKDKKAKGGDSRSMTPVPTAATTPVVIEGKLDGDKADVTVTVDPQLEQVEEQGGEGDAQPLTDTLTEATPERVLENQDDASVKAEVKEEGGEDKANDKSDDVANPIKDALTESAEKEGDVEDGEAASAQSNSKKKKKKKNGSKPPTRAPTPEASQDDKNRANVIDDVTPELTGGEVTDIPAKAMNPEETADVADGDGNHSDGPGDNKKRKKGKGGQKPTSSIELSINLSKSKKGEKGKENSIDISTPPTPSTPKTEVTTRDQPDSTLREEDLKGPAEIPDVNKVEDPEQAVAITEPPVEADKLPDDIPVEEVPTLDTTHDQKPNETSDPPVEGNEEPSNTPDGSAQNQEESTNAPENAETSAPIEQVLEPVGDSTIEVPMESTVDTGFSEGALQSGIPSAADGEPPEKPPTGDDSIPDVGEQPVEDIRATATKGKKKKKKDSTGWTDEAVVEPRAETTMESEKKTEEIVAEGDIEGKRKETEPIPSEPSIATKGGNGKGKNSKGKKGKGKNQPEVVLTEDVKSPEHPVTDISTAVTPVQIPSTPDPGPNPLFPSLGAAVVEGESVSPSSSLLFGSKSKLRPSEFVSRSKDLDSKVTAAEEVVRSTEASYLELEAEANQLGEPSSGFGEAQKAVGELGDIRLDIENTLRSMPSREQLIPRSLSPNTQMREQELREENNELRGYVDDMVNLYESTAKKAGEKVNWSHEAIRRLSEPIIKFLEKEDARKVRRDAMLHNFKGKLRDMQTAFQDLDQVRHRGLELVSELEKKEATLILDDSELERLRNELQLSQSAVKDFELRQKEFDAKVKELGTQLAEALSNAGSETTARQQAEEKVKELQSRTDQLKSDLDGAREKEKTLLDAVDALRNDLKIAEESKADLSMKHTDLETKLANLQQKYSDLEATHEQVAKDLRDSLDEKSRLLADNEQKDGQLVEFEQEIKAWRDQAPIDEEGSESELTRFIDEQLREFEKLETEYQKQLARRDGDLVVIRERNVTLSNEIQAKTERVEQLELQHSEMSSSLSLLVSEIELKNKGVETIIRALFELRGVISFLDDEMTSRESTIATLREEVHALKIQSDYENAERHKQSESLEARLRMFKDNMSGLISELNEVLACNSNVSTPGDKSVPFLPLTGSMDDVESIASLEQGIKNRMGALKQSIVTRNSAMEDALQEIASLKDRIQSFESRLQAQTEKTDKVTDEKTQLEGQLQTAKEEAKEQAKSIKALNKDITKLTTEQRNLQNELEKDRQTIEEIKQENANLQGNLQSLREDLDRTSAQASDERADWEQREKNLLQQLEEERATFAKQKAEAEEKIRNLKNTIDRLDVTLRQERAYKDEMKSRIKAAREEDINRLRSPALDLSTARENLSKNFQEVRDRVKARGRTLSRTRAPMILSSAFGSRDGSPQPRRDSFDTPNSTSPLFPSGSKSPVHPSRFA